MKIDLIMWTYNGANKLSKTLPRINQVLPANVIRKKIASDDNSTDDTRDLLKKYGWETHINRGPRGIGNNAQNAFDKVKTEFVACFEQDLFLAADWWRVLSAELTKPENRNVALFVGRRLPNLPIVRSYLKHRYDLSSARGTGETPMDNTILRTAAVRQVGGFAKVQFAGIDTLLRKELEANGWRCIVKDKVISVHLRDSLRESLDHFRGYVRTNPAFDRGRKSEKIYRGLFLRSLLAGVNLAYKTRDINMVWFYPLTRLYMFLGFMDARKAAVA